MPIETTPNPAATPETTPLPGGGSWHWDATIAGWVENPPYGAADPAAPIAPTVLVTPQE